MFSTRPGANGTEVSRMHSAHVALAAAVRCRLRLRAAPRCTGRSSQTQAAADPQAPSGATRIGAPTFHRGVCDPDAGRRPDCQSPASHENIRGETDRAEAAAERHSCSSRNSSSDAATCTGRACAHSAHKLAIVFGGGANESASGDAPQAARATGAVVRLPESLPSRFQADNI
jgi:hypothetical protein